MSKYKIIAFLLAVVGLVMILYGVNTKSTPAANTAEEPLPTVEEPEPVPEEPVTQQISDQSTGYWYKNDDVTDTLNYVHVISNENQTLTFDWHVSEVSPDSTSVSAIQLDAVTTTRFEENKYYFTYNDVEYSITFNPPEYYIQIDYNGTSYTYTYYQNAAREG